MEESKLSKLTQTQTDHLNEPITTDEIVQTINNLKQGKAPGPDRLSADYYKMITDQITEHLQLMFIDLMNGQEYLPTGTETHIKVIPKPGRDPELPNSYRPILLINIDAKLLSRMLAERLETCQRLSTWRKPGLPNPGPRYLT